MGEKHDVSCRGTCTACRVYTLMLYTISVKCSIRRVDYAQLTLDRIVCVWDVIGHGCGEFRGCRFWHRGVIKDGL